MAPELQSQEERSKKDATQWPLLSQATLHSEEVLPGTSTRTEP